VREAKEREGLENIRLLDYFPRESLHTSLTLADVHLISMRPEMTGIVVPGKLYGAMAAGRPTLFVGPLACESADTIREADCGFTVERGDSQGVVDAIERLADDPLLVRQLGDQGRAAFLAGYERESCCERWSQLLNGLLASQEETKLRFVPSGAEVWTAGPSTIASVELGRH
jgi:glycosyltransferase involved in cell wall biosynthesis